MKVVIGLLVAIGWSGALANEPRQRTLTFEDRVQAQSALERVYYAHRIGVTETFEQAMPRVVLERKVRTYIEQTAALAVYWKITVTDEMLVGELDRMAARSRMPERLRELYAALGNDTVLIKECLARATLVDRLARDSYAFDPAIHKDARRRAEALHSGLESGALSPLADAPERSVNTISVDEPQRKDRLLRHESLSTRDRRRRRSEFPDAVGRVSALEETRDGFRISVVLNESPHEFRVARYVVPKVSWDRWWGPVGPAMQAGSRPSENVVAATDSAPARALDGVRQAYLGTLCPADGVWAPTPSTNAPSARELHTAVWTGAEMIVWGGYFFDGADILWDTGARYDPATDSWAETSTTGAPSPRGLHTAVWTGSRMVVWGGADLNGYFASGGRYDPTTDSWAPTATTGAPPARVNHTAVWTGSRMIVWGGYFYDGADHQLNTGGQYDPVGDTWASTSMAAGVPSPRELHTAVWTGNRMVVWGGWTGANLANTGGRYDPTTNTWTATSTTSAPPGVELHTAVWTGNRMVVWGGWDGFGDVDSGGRYDPVADSWTATALTGAASPRDSHTAVWTGSRMVVWGGGFYDGVDFFALETGTIYDPATNSWAATSTTGVPAARFYHTAVWTGTVMIVWGGEDTFVFFDSGASYAFGSSVDNDGDGYTGCGGDCDDSNPAVHPGAPEPCNGIDDDCNAVTDDGGDVACDDANPCTTDACIGVAGCSHVIDTQPCSDANACTADSCIPASGCVYPSANLDGTGFSVARVDGRDLVILADAWNSCPTDPPPTRYVAAANLDPGTPCIGDTDFHLFMTTFGRTCP